MAIHSTTDGLALGIQAETPATGATKWSLFCALCIHKIPEGLALGSLLIGAGLQRATAVGWVAAVEATTLLGGAIGYFFMTNISTLWLGLIIHVLAIYGMVRGLRASRELERLAAAEQTLAAGATAPHIG